MVPTTAYATRLRGPGVRRTRNGDNAGHADHGHVDLHFEDGRVETYGFEMLTRLSLMGQDAPIKGLREVHVHVNHELFAGGLELIDTAGFQDGTRDTTDVLIGEIGQAEVVIVVLSGMALLSDTERCLIRELCVDHHKTVVPVVNWMNAVDPGGSAEAIGLLEQYVSRLPNIGLGSRYYCIDPLRAARDVRDHGRPVGDLANLVNDLRSFNAKAAARKARLGRCASLVRRMRLLAAPLQDHFRIVAKTRRERERPELHKLRTLYRRLAESEGEVVERVDTAAAKLVESTAEAMTAWMAATLVTTIQTEAPKVLGAHLDLMAVGIEKHLDAELRTLAERLDLPPVTSGYAAVVRESWKSIDGYALAPPDYRSAGGFGKFFKDVFEDYGRHAAVRFYEGEWRVIMKAVVREMTASAARAVGELRTRLNASIAVLELPVDGDGLVACGILAARVDELACELVAVYSQDAAGLDWGSKIASGRETSVDVLPDEFLAENWISSQTICQVLEGAGISASIDGDGDVKLTLDSGRTVFVMVDQKRKFLRFLVLLKYDAPTQAKLEASVAGVNRDLMMVCASVKKESTVSFDYCLPFAGGIPAFTVLSALRLFGASVSVASERILEELAG